MNMWLPADGAALTLEDFLPQSEQGRILFTTRNRKLAVELTSSNIISIRDADEEIAFKILERSLIQEGLLQDHVTTVALLEQLTFLPLAITQASAYINKNGLSLSTYLALLQEQEPDVVDLLSEDFKDAGRYKDIQNPVITTWLISFNQIQHQNQLAADYLSFMACINPRNIPQSILPLSTSRKRGIDALGLLNAYSFTSGQDMAISIHRLVHVATRNWLRKNALFSHWIQKVADQILKVLPDNHYTNRGLWREYLPHALSLVSENEFIIQREQYIDLINRVAGCLASDGRCNEAGVLYSDVMKIYLQKIGPEHPSALISMDNLASTYQNQGQWKEAEMLQVQVMETRKTVLGAEHPDTLISMNNLALTYQNQGQWKEAEMLQAQVMGTFKTVLGDKHPSTLTSMSNLASTYQYQGQWKEAEMLQVQVMETRKTVLGDEHPSTLTSMSNLACTWKSLGKLQDALALMESCSKLFNKKLGPNHPHTRSSCRAFSDWKGVQNPLPNETIAAAPVTVNGQQSTANDQLPMVANTAGGVI